MSEAELWNAYRSGDEEARVRLISAHLGLVRHVARGIQRRLMNVVELDELMSAGTLGLVEAIERFDHTRNLAFSTYAVPRIRGAILDELRRVDHVPSSVRRRARALGNARDELSSDLGRAPDSNETASHLGVDAATFGRMQGDVAATMLVGLDDVRSSDDEGYTLADVLPAPEDDIDDRLSRSRELELLRDAISRLPSVERQVLTLYYYEELKLQDIARVLEVTESRVCQIKQKALIRLRGALGALRPRVA